MKHHTAPTFKEKQSVRTRLFGSFNRIIVFLTFSDVFTWGLYLGVSSLVGLYFTTKFEDHVAEYVGIGISISFIFRAICQIPVGIISDRIKRDSDDLIFLIAGNLLMGLPFFLYPIIDSPIVYYICQGVFGIGSAMNLVSWRKLFAQNIDKGKEGMEYASYETILSISIAIYSAVFGVIANMGRYYFDLLMVSIGFLFLLSCIFVGLIFSIKNRKSYKI